MPIAAVVALASCDDSSTSADEPPSTAAESPGTDVATAAAVAEQFIAALNDRAAPTAASSVKSGAPIAVSPLAPGEALDKDVTLDEQIGWLAAWDWRWDDVACTGTEAPQVPTSFDLVEEGEDRGVVVEFDTSVACNVVAHTKLGDVDDASVGHTMQFRLRDGAITNVSWSTPPIAVSPMSPSEAVDRGVTIADQIAWLDAWGWRSDDVTCVVDDTLPEPTTARPAEAGSDGAPTVPVEFDTTATCRVVAHTKLGQVDDVSRAGTMGFRLLDGTVTWVHATSGPLTWMPQFLDFKEWAETERTDQWSQAWDDGGPLLTATSTDVEGRLLDEYINR